jgi:hypothetical protein
MFNQFADNLKKILLHLFGVLDADYVNDVLNDMRFELASCLKNHYEVRFGLFKKSTVELKTSVLFPTEKEADQIAKMSDARVGILLIPRE